MAVTVRKARHRRPATKPHVATPGATPASGRSGGGGPSGATTIYLVRHGRTGLTANGLLGGRLDPSLDSVGLLQATMLAQALRKKDELRLIVSSPLRRAAETAEAVAMRTGLRVEIDPRLIDRDYGSWAGRSPEALIAEWGSVDEAPGVEPRLEALARAFEALADLSGRVVGGSAAVISHDVVNRLLLGALDPGLGEADTLPQDTGCFNVIERRNGRWSVLDINNVPSEGEGSWPP